MEILHAVAAGLVPPLCAACGRSCRPEAVVCTRCGRRLAAAEPLLGKGPPGLDRAWSSAPARGCRPQPGRGAQVPPPAAGRRPDGRPDPVARPGSHAERRDRPGPAGAVAAAAARLRSRRRARGGPGGAPRAPLEQCLARRGGRRQVGRRRAERIGHPPRIHATGAAPRSVMLVDDVLTTGATLTACATALRSAGAARVVAVTFARRLWRAADRRRSAGSALEAPVPGVRRPV